MLNVAFRLDSSITIGMGHLMRCMALAEELVNQGNSVYFISKNLSGNSNHILRNYGFKVLELPSALNSVETFSWEEDAKECCNILSKIENKADLIVIDHYGIDYRWEKQIKSYDNRLLVIDDLYDRKHICDYFLNQNTINDKQLSINVPKDCVKFLGPGFALLRKEFRESKYRQIAHSGKVDRVNIFFGGSDNKNLTEKVLLTLKNSPHFAKEYHVIVNEKNEHKEKITKICDGLPNADLLFNVSNMAKQFSKADLAIGAGGSSTWERAFLGLPSILITFVDNQIEIAEVASGKGAAIYLGDYKEIQLDTLSETISDLERNPLVVKTMSKNAKALVDGRGASKICKVIG